VLNPATKKSELAGKIFDATSTLSWASVADYRDHDGAAPWNRVISGISTDADWIRGSGIQPGSSSGEYQIFKTQVNAPVLEPATMLLFGIGLLGLAGVSRRKIRS
jgi:hypothetical protein